MENSGDTVLVVPADQVTEPEVQQKNPDPKAPLPDAEAPVLDAEAPVPDAEAPVPDEQAPVPDAQAPVPDAQAPVLDAQAPVSDAQAPVVDTPVPAPDVIKSASNQSSNGGLGNTVAKHYNQLEETGLEARLQSRIFYMRNLNNWIKSVVIAEFIQEIRKRNGSAYEINALDLGSGKGGDLLKWKKGNISHLICADIAGTSVEQCETRYKEMVERNSRDRYQQTMFTSEFITADCTKDRLKDRFSDPNSAIDLTSCQFAYHYSFESYEQADRMLQNACEALKPGGYFMGTTPNAFELIKRWRAAEGNNFGNEIYQVTFDSDNKEDIPLFGAKYMFHLEGVVDCPEFLVHFPTFVKLAKKHGMNLLYKKTFAEYVAENSKKSDSRTLLGKMQALEPYPADDDSALLCKKEDGYNAAKEAHAKLYEEARERGDHDGKLRRLKVGTLSQDDWDASTLYIVFAFQKDGGQLQESTEHTTTPSRKRTRWESEQTIQDTEQTASPSRKRPHEEAEVTAQETVDQEMAEDTVAQGESVVVTERAEDTADQAYVVAEMAEDTADQADVVAKMAEDTADQADVVAEKSSEVE